MRFFSVAVLCLGVSLAACGGSSSLSSSSDDFVPASTASAVPAVVADNTSLPAAETGIPGVRRSMLVPIGAQPVPGTPVESLPEHADHRPIIQTPAPARLHSQVKLTALRNLYVSTQGNDSASGLAGSPVRTIAKALTLAKPGDIIHVAQGTYAEAIVIGPDVAKGTADAKIVLLGEDSPTLVPPSGTFGYALVEVARPHWIISGFRLDVKNLAKYAVAYHDETTGAVLENSELYRGTLGAGVTTHDGANEVLISNNHIHHFSRGNADSHGVVIQPTSQNITIRNNDIHHVSGDSVQCLGPEGFSAKAPAKGIVIESNHFFSNRENAVDIKTCSDVVVRANRMHDFTRSTTVGGAVVVIHMSAKNVIVEDNAIYDGGKGIALGGNHTGAVPNHVVIRRNKIHRMKANAQLEGVGIRIENSQGAVVANNTITDVQGAAVVLGHGTGGPTSQLTMINNVLDAKEGVDSGDAAPGLLSENNLFRSNAAFVKNKVAMDLKRWQQSGKDETSLQASGTLVSQDDRLAAGSISVDSGLTESEVPFCGAGPDLGAFESDCP